MRGPVKRGTVWNRFSEGEHRKNKRALSWGVERKAKQREREEGI